MSLPRLRLHMLRSKIDAMTWWSENCWAVVWIAFGYVLGVLSAVILYAHPWPWGSQ